MQLFFLSSLVSLTYASSTSRPNSHSQDLAKKEINPFFNTSDATLDEKGRVNTSGRYLSNRIKNQNRRYKAFSIQDKISLGKLLKVLDQGLKIRVSNIDGQSYDIDQSICSSDIIFNLKFYWQKFIGEEFIFEDYIEELITLARSFSRLDDISFQLLYQDALIYKSWMDKKKTFLLLEQTEFLFLNNHPQVQGLILNWTNSLKRFQQRENANTGFCADKTFVSLWQNSGVFLSTLLSQNSQKRTLKSLNQYFGHQGEDRFISPGTHLGKSLSLWTNSLWSSLWLTFNRNLKQRPSVLKLSHRDYDLVDFIAYKAFKRSSRALRDFKSNQEVNKTVEKLTGSQTQTLSNWIDLLKDPSQWKELNQLVTQSALKSNLRPLSSSNFNHQISLGQYLQKREVIRHRFASPNHVFTPQTFSSEASLTDKKFSIREDLYKNYSPIQIGMLALLFKNLANRLPGKGSIILEYSDEEKYLKESLSTKKDHSENNAFIDEQLINDYSLTIEKIPLDPMEYFRLVLKLMRKEINQLSHSSHFAGKTIAFEHVLMAAYECGLVQGKDLSVFHQLKEVWSPKKTKQDIFLEYLKKYGTVGSLLLPGAYQIAYVVGVIFVEILFTAKKNPDTTKEFSLF